MNILLITPFFPYPPTSGGNTRTFNLLKQMGRRDARIVLGLITAEPIEQDNWNEFHRMLPHVKTIRLPYDNRTREKGAYYALNLVNADKHFCYRTIKNNIRHLIRNERINIVHIDYSQAARFLPSQISIPSILTYIEYRSRVIDRESTICENAVRSLAKQIRRFFLQREELSHTSRYDAFICMSKEDRKWLLTKSPGLNAYVVENGVDIKTYHFNAFSTGINGLYYLGWFTNRQNLYALDYFLDRIWPHVRNEVPDFIVAGSDLDRVHRERLERQGIPYLGFVETETLRKRTEGKALVVPLLSGSGTRLKILEALAWGNPVVSTTIGAEGLDVEAGKHLLLADTADEFRRQIVRLKHEPDLAAYIAKQGRAIVEQKYDWSILAQKLNTLYATVLSQKV